MSCTEYQKRPSTLWLVLLDDAERNILTTDLADDQKNESCNLSDICDECRDLAFINTRDVEIFKCEHHEIDDDA